MINGYKLRGTEQNIPPVKRSNQFRTAVFAALAIFAFTTASLASSDRKSDRPDRVDRKDDKSSSHELSCGVENFGKVTEFYYRGAQPKEDEYSELAAIGVKTVIDLRDDPKGYAREMAKRAGLKYVNMPLSDTRYPSSETAPAFLTLVNDQNNWPVYVHCAGGRHRTGAMTAVFRMTIQGWGIERAYDEMKDYDFYTSWGHKKMKTFVFDYYRELTHRRVMQPADPSTRARYVTEDANQ
ncbi:MAG: fused DSP-PTPase phosphatase/NAD kinase-like protein [Blastocatellia bacterium]